MKVVKTGMHSFKGLEVRELVQVKSVKCGIALFPPGCALPEDGTTQHDVDEFSFILEGELRIVSGGETFEVGPGDLIHIPREEEHRSVTLGDKPCRLIWFLSGS